MDEPQRSRRPSERKAKAAGLGTSESRTIEPWDRADTFFAMNAAKRGMSIAEIAGFLGRTEDEVLEQLRFIYLNMGDTSEIVCPYCSTLFRFDPSLGAHEADPAGCAYGVTWTELKSSNAASLVMLPAANQRQAPSSRSLGAVHDGHERSEFGNMQGSRRPNQR